MSHSLVFNTSFVNYLANVRDLSPLLRGGVDTGRVVGTGVQENDGLLRCRLQETILGYD